MKWKCVPVLAAFALAGCFGDVVKDSGFDLWCGPSLCQWTTEKGSVRRVSTWHEDDYGVELVGTPTVLSQHVNVGDRCLKFTVMADVETEAEVSLELDFFQDGEADYSESIPSARWRRLEFLVKMPADAHEGVRLSLDKKGPGKAVFGELSAEFVGACHGNPIVLSNLPFGYRCSENSECGAGLCVGSGESGEPTAPAPLCGECLRDDQCGGGSRCGVFPVADYLSSLGLSPANTYRACVEPASVVLGRPCSSGWECQSGVCSNLATLGTVLGTSSCGECAEDSDCQTGKLCGAELSSDGLRYRTCVDAESRTTRTQCVKSAECANGLACCAGACGLGESCARQ